MNSPKAVSYSRLKIILTEWFAGFEYKPILSDPANKRRKANFLLHAVVQRRQYQIISRYPIIIVWAYEEQEISLSFFIKEGFHIQAE